MQILVPSVQTGRITLVIFDLKNLQQQLTEGEVPGTLYGLSEKGWIDADLFNGWLTNTFREICYL